MENRNDVFSTDVTLENYRKILNVSDKATAEEIDRAFKPLLLQYHADVQSAKGLDNIVRGQLEGEVNETLLKKADVTIEKNFTAYKALSNARAEYDRTIASKKSDSNAIELTRQQLKGDETFYYYHTTISLPIDHDIYEKNTNPNKNTILLEKSYQDVPDQLKKQIVKDLFFGLCPHYSSSAVIFSCEEDARDWNRYDYFKTEKGKENCVITVKIIMSPQDLEEAIYTTQASKWNTQLVDLREAKLKGSVYYMTAPGYINFNNAIHHIHSVKLFDIARKPQINFIYPGHQLLQFAATEIKTETQLLTYFKNKIIENLTNSERKFVNKMVQQGTIGHFIGTLLRIEAIKNIDTHLSTLRTLANSNYTNFEACIKTVEPAINKIIPFGSQELVTNLQNLLVEVKGIYDNKFGAFVPRVTG